MKLPDRITGGARLGTTSLLTRLAIGARDGWDCRRSVYCWSEIACVQFKMTFEGLGVNPRVPH